MSSQEGIELEIKRICDSNEELRDLETQLKVAYMNKERAAQLQEAMAQQIFEGKLEHAISEIMKKDRLAAAHSEIEREERMHEQRRTQKKEMQQQIAEKEVSL